MKRKYWPKRNETIGPNETKLLVQTKRNYWPKLSRHWNVIYLAVNAQFFKHFLSLKKSQIHLPILLFRESNKNVAKREKLLHADWLTRAISPLFRAFFISVVLFKFGIKNFEKGKSTARGRLDFQPFWESVIILFPTNGWITGPYRLSVTSHPLFMQLTIKRQYKH